MAKKCRAGQFLIVMVDEEGERVPLTIAEYDQGRRERYHHIPKSGLLYQAAWGEKSGETASLLWQVLLVKR